MFKCKVHIVAFKIVLDVCELPILESMAAACARFLFWRAYSYREGRCAWTWVWSLSPSGIAVGRMQFPIKLCKREQLLCLADCDHKS